MENWTSSKIQPFHKGKIPDIFEKITSLYLHPKWLENSGMTIFLILKNPNPYKPCNSNSHRNNSSNL